jgi:hypothetical protein
MQGRSLDLLLVLLPAVLRTRPSRQDRPYFRSMRPESESGCSVDWSYTVWTSKEGYHFQHDSNFSSAAPIEFSDSDHLRFVEVERIRLLATFIRRRTANGGSFWI